MHNNSSLSCTSHPARFMVHSHSGILAASELLSQLALDRVLPPLFLLPLPLTHAPYVAVLSFSTFSALLYASAGARLPVLSEMFSLVWLAVMLLFPVSLLLLKFNRGRLRRRRSGARLGLGVILGAVGVAAGYDGGDV